MGLWKGFVMTDFALVKEGFVFNVIIAEDRAAAEPFMAIFGCDELIEANEATGGASPGWTWDGEHFVNPSPPDLEPVPLEE